MSALDSSTRDDGNCDQGPQAYKEDQGSYRLRKHSDWCTAKAHPKNVQQNDAHQEKSNVGMSKHLRHDGMEEKSGKAVTEKT